jgi:class 3 adenylate cyclase
VCNSPPVPGQPARFAPFGVSTISSVPTYLDRHETPPGVTQEQVAEAHNADVEAQEKYGVHYHTYWFDPDERTVFCLAEGPNKQAIVDVHRTAHGMLASAIIEVGPTAPLNALMGALPNHPPGTPYVAPAMRAIVFTDIRGSVAQTMQLGDDAHMALLSEHNRIVREALASHEGREVKHTGDGIMAAFTSVSSAVAFAIDLQQHMALRNATADTPFQVGIGISAGEPVTDDHEDLFGAAVQLAARLCAAAPAGGIEVSVAVKELCIGKQFHFGTCTFAELKGFDEPVASHSVAWLPST